MVITDTERKLALIDKAIAVHGPNIKLGKFMLESKFNLYKFTVHYSIPGVDGYSTGEVYEDGFMLKIKEKNQLRLERKRAGN